MGYQKLQVGRITAMDRLQSDNDDCVNLNDVLFTFTAAAGTSGGDARVVGPANTFVDTNGKNLVQVGDLLRNDSSPNSNCSRIVSIVGDDTVYVQTGLTFNSGQDITVFKGSDEPAVLYVGTHPGSGSITLKVRTEGGDDITFHNPPEGSFLPVQVKRVFRTNTTVTDVLALF